jgi:hypothetical protein
MARKIINPRWGNEEKTVILATFKYDDGRELIASISNVDDMMNPDWKEIMDTFGVDMLDQNTGDALESHMKRKAERAERAKIDQDRAIKESLFNLKAEAFDMEIVKNSKNRDVKNKIRRAATPTEVLVYTALLHMLEDPLAKPTE